MLSGIWCRPKPFSQCQYSFQMKSGLPWAYKRLLDATGGCSCNLKLVTFKVVSSIDILSICYEIALRYMPQDLANDKSTLVQVMAWCRQATGHYLSRSWHCATMPSWVCPAPQCARSNGVPHSCVVVWPTMAPDAKPWSIPTTCMLHVC